MGLELWRENVKVLTLDFRMSDVLVLMDNLSQGMEHGGLLESTCSLLL